MAEDQSPQAIVLGLQAPLPMLPTSIIKERRPRVQLALSSELCFQQQGNPRVLGVSGTVPSPSKQGVNLWEPPGDDNDVTGPDSGRGCGAALISMLGQCFRPSVTVGALKHKAGTASFSGSCRSEASEVLPGRDGSKPPSRKDTGVLMTCLTSASSSQRDSVSPPGRTPSPEGYHLKELVWVKKELI